MPSDGPRTGDQDIDKSSGAWLPVGDGGNFWGRRSGAEQVERVEICADVAAFGGALYQGVNRPLYLGAGTLV